MDILLIIDMQKALFDIPRFDSNRVVSRINLIAEKIRSKTGKVVFIQHDGSKEEGLFPNSEGWQLLEKLFIGETDLFVRKTTCDSFYNTSLQEKLSTNHVKRLFITGCATDFCVDSTIRSAISKNYNIVVVEDGHTTGDRSHLEAKKIIEHHNWVWKNLAVSKGELKVELTANILK